MQELIPINIVVGDRTYRIKISPDDEQDVRSTLKNINDKIFEFKTQFAGKDMQDYIAMVLLWFATQGIGPENAQKTASALQDSLQRIENQLDKAL